MEIRDAVTALAALAQETRLAIYRLLVEAGPGGVSAGRIGVRLVRMHDTRIAAQLVRHVQPRMPRRDEDMRRLDSGDDEAITLDRLLQSVEGARRLGVVILDACRDNPFARTMKRARTASLRAGVTAAS